MPRGSGSNARVFHPDLAFRNPDPPCDDAVRAALAMRAELFEYNRELAAEGLPTLAFGIGLHRGPEWRASSEALS